MKLADYLERLIVVLERIAVALERQPVQIAPFLPIQPNELWPFPNVPRQPPTIMAYAAYPADGTPAAGSEAPRLTGDWYSGTEPKKP